MNNLNLESILLFLKNNYFYFLIGFLVLAVRFGSYFGYKTNERNKIYASQEVYEEFLEEINSFEETDIEALENLSYKLKDIYDESTYSLMADFYLVKIYFENGEEEKALNTILELNSTLEGENSSKSFLRDLSRIRLASIYLNFDRFDEAREVLIRNFDYYDSLRLEKLGDLEKEDLNPKKAEDYYNQAIELSDNQTQINLLNFKLSSLASSSNVN
jgi:predicted negative regulator of RcsB-dependent stress response